MATITYIVKVASGKFTIDDAVAPKLTFRDGDTYVFDQADNSNSGHTLQFSATSNNSGSSEYTTGVTKTGTAGSAGAKTTIVTSGSTTDTLYYYSSGGGTHGAEFSNTGYKTSSNYNLIKPIVGSTLSEEKWGPMVNHMVDQIDESIKSIDQNLLGQDLDGATDSGTVAVDLDTQSLTVAGSNGIATSGSGQTITVSGEALAHQGEPHIQLQKLYPAVAGKLLDGSTSHSGDYGTAQSDGRKYYYTSIKGSKPIKDPRIGAYFGSQRHKFKSLQLLEQETAMEGKNIFSVDGREWIRAYSTGGGWNEVNDAGGTYIRADSDATGCFLEITGYFNDINFMFYCWNNRVDDIDISVNGTLSVDESITLGGDTSVETPLKSRFVDASSVINGGSTLSSSLGTTPKINTIRYEAKTGSSEYLAIMGIELIAQDTTSTANRSKIQIPAQTVVSYGKKHSISATAQHYDPFNGFVNDTTLFSAKVDTATSLGLGTATTWGCAWDKGSDNHIRPLNGGRVVKWIDSSGNIKTSVTMMPRNAQNIGNNTTNGSAGTVSNEIGTASATNTHTINFSDDVIDNSLSEIATTFHYRELGNGAANTGGGGSWADASMVSGSPDDLSFVMDDGLTSLSANDCNDTTANFDCLRWENGSNDDQWLFTFIGTGISWEGTANMASNDRRNHIYAQNLPYGTHVVKVIRTGSAAGDIIIDGVTVDQPASGADDSKLGVGWITIYQPKMPPIPQDAVIIADYMLMADFVADSAGAIESISKGTRLLGASRDILLNENTNQTYPLTHQPKDTNQGIHIEGAGGQISSGTLQISVTYFGKEVCWKLYATQYGTLSEHINSTTITDTALSTSAWGGKRKVTGQTLGINGIKNTQTSGDFGFNGVEIATPIHTSSHYQTFETPFLHELVGGDRNMEQTNLVVTPDGKTWDQISRDTGYMGSILVSANIDQNSTDGDYWWLMDNFRGDWTDHGNTNKGGGLGNKDFAIAYDRFICLKDGQYKIEARSYNSSAGKSNRIYVNGTEVSQGVMGGGDHGYYNMLNTRLNRGDYIQVRGEVYSNTNYKNFNVFNITKL